MMLPFSPDAFFQVFAEYNRTLWPAVVVLWLTSAGLVVAVWRRPARSGWMTIFLGLLWAWNAVAYHAVFFTRINPAAWLFAAAFAIQSAILVTAGRSAELEYFASKGARAIVGASLTIYALAYPMLTQAFGHRYPGAPTFGVPCPTDLLTVGLLLTIRKPIPLSLAVIPALWGLVGGSAAIVLTVTTDFVLLAAGILLPVLLVAERHRRWLLPSLGRLTIVRRRLL